MNSDFKAEVREEEELHGLPSVIEDRPQIWTFVSVSYKLGGRV